MSDAPPRVFVERVVIVASILLAFSVQAWWDLRSTTLTIRLLRRSEEPSQIAPDSCGSAGGRGE